MIGRFPEQQAARRYDEPLLQRQIRLDQAAPIFQG